MRKLRELICQRRSARRPHSGFVNGRSGAREALPCLLHQCAGVRCDDVDVCINAFGDLIPSEGCVYACPGLILHYVEEHGYVPPEYFVRAVRDLQINAARYDPKSNC